MKKSPLNFGFGALLGGGSIRGIADMLRSRRSKNRVGGSQNAVGAVQKALDSYMTESDENKAKRLQARVDSRIKRFDHETDDEGNVMGTDTSFINEKTQELQDRATQHLDNAETSKSNAQLKKLKAALTAGTITQAQYNELIK